MNTMKTAHRTVSQLYKDVEKLRASLPGLAPAVDRPVLVVVSGLPGSGKSHFSRRLAEQVPLLVLQSDALRKVLFPSPSYTKEESARLFAACYSLIEELLEQGIPMLLDATNLIEEHRERLCYIAGRLGVKPVLVYLEAPPKVVYQRLKERSEGMDSQDQSGAGWDVYLRMSATVEPIKRGHLVVDTSKDISPAIARVARDIKLWMRTG